MRTTTILRTTTIRTAAVLLATGLGHAVPAQGASPASTPSTVEVPNSTRTVVAVYAAGSLKDVLTELARQFEAETSHEVATTFAASGLLRERIEQGEQAEVFASANMGHPARLASDGGWTKPAMFTRNVLCALAQPNLRVDSDNLLDVLLDPAIRVGTSTPKADPSGDYAWDLFRKADTLRPGAFAQLEGKAQQLTGGPDSPRPPAGRGTYEWVMAEGQADIFLSYCTNAVAARKAQPQLQVIEIPAALQVGADYGLSVRKDASAAAHGFSQYLLSSEAQAVFRQYGFGAI